MGGATLLSRIFGFIRDMIVAQFFGAGMATDAFFVAFRIPNLLRRLVGEGALTASFIPVYTEYLTQRPPEEAREFVRATFSVLAVFLFILTGLGDPVGPLDREGHGLRLFPGSREIGTDRPPHPPDVPLYFFHRTGRSGHGGVEFLEAFFRPRFGARPFEPVHHPVRPGLLPFFFGADPGAGLGGSLGRDRPARFSVAFPAKKRDLSGVSDSNRPIRG